MGARLILCFVAIGGNAVTFGVEPAKESIVIVSYENDRQRMIRDDVSKLSGVLEACGYAPRVLHNQSPEQLEEKLKSSPLHDPRYVFFDAHGDAAPNGELLLGTEPMGQYNDPNRQLASSVRTVRASALQTVLHRYVPQPQFWFNTCHADACNCIGPGGVGASCRAQQLTFGNTTSMAIASLLCSRKTDCALWKGVDRNGDGVIDGKELARYFATLFPSTSAPASVRVFPAVDSFGISLEVRSCERKGGNAEQNRGIMLTAQAPSRPVINVSEHVSRTSVLRRSRLEGDPEVTLFETREAAREALERRLRHTALSELAISGTTRLNPETTLEFHDVTQVRCLLPLPNASAIPGQVQIAEPRNFTLEAPQCARSYEERMPPRSGPGLLWREYLKNHEL